VTAPTSPEDLLTPAQVAEHFNVNPKTVTRWAAEGRLPSTRTPGGHRRYRRADVEAAPAASLNDLLVNALHAAKRIRFERTDDGYTVLAADGGRVHTGTGGTPAEALAAAMRKVATVRAQNEEESR
jgi:excisionase family DNA binding protein